MEIELPVRHTHADRELPPADRGKDAWLFLAACFTLEAVIWGSSSLYQMRDKTGWQNSAD